MEGRGSEGRVRSPGLSADDEVLFWDPVGKHPARGKVIAVVPIVERYVILEYEGAEVQVPLRWTHPFPKDRSVADSGATGSAVTGAT